MYCCCLSRTFRFTSRSLNLCQSSFMTSFFFVNSLFLNWQTCIEAFCYLYYTSYSCLEQYFGTFFPDGYCIFLAFSILTFNWYNFIHHFGLTNCLLFYIFLITGDALHSLRINLVDPNNVLQSWDPTLVNPCTWFHVTCNSDNSVVRV